MKRIYIYIVLLVAICFASCSEDTTEYQQPSVCTFSVPVSIASDNQVIFTNDSTKSAAKIATRATTVGDPGYNDSLPVPQHLYLWAFVKMQTSVTYNGADCQYQLLYRHFDKNSSDVNTAIDWDYTLGSKNTEDQDTRFYTSLITFSTDRLLNSDANGCGRVYAVASNKTLVDEATKTSSYLPTELLKVIQNGTQKANGQYQLDISSDEKSAVESSVLSLSDWTSENLCHLYSSPNEATTTTDGITVYNGTVTYANNNITVEHLKLYHCAAKIDFTWDIDSALQKTTSVSTITAKNLPTQCKVFDPTHNPTGTIGTCLVLGTSGAVNTLTPGNQWIGRAYAYVLQQPVTGTAPSTAGATLNATTTFANPSDASDSATKRSDATTAFTPTTPNAIYTGWYRINARIK